MQPNVMTSSRYRNEYIDNTVCFWTSSIVDCLPVFHSHARGKARARVWKERGHAFPITDAETLREKVDYIHNNPVKKGLADQPKGWEFSSAMWYLNGSGPLAMDEFDWL